MVWQKLRGHESTSWSSHAFAKSGALLCAAVVILGVDYFVFDCAYIPRQFSEMAFGKCFSTMTRVLHVPKVHRSSKIDIASLEPVIA